MVHAGGGGGQNHIGSKWSVIITDHFKMKFFFEKFWWTIWSAGGGGGQNHIGSKWSVMITDHFGTNVVPTPQSEPHCTHIQTDSDYTKCVVETLQDHMLKNPQMAAFSPKFKSE